MSFPPITIPDLDPAVTVDRDNDLVLLRQGLNDRKATVAQISEVDLSNYSLLSGPILSSDVFLIGRNSGGGNYLNLLAQPNKVTFLSGVRVWFYLTAAPSGWSTVTGTGDRVLATQLAGGAPFTYNAFGLQKGWLQANHTLTIDEMPSHTHDIRVYAALTTAFNTRVANGKNDTYNVAQTRSTGGDQPHNHGDQWRPQAAVGLIAQKD